MHQLILVLTIPGSRRQNQSSIVLNEYNNTSKDWEQLPIISLGNDCQKLHFVGNVSNYSSFAITGNESTNESTNESDVC